MNIVLTGFMATGKSVVGRLLAHDLGLTHIDTDELIEKLSGKAVREIFATDGEARFRALEKEAVEKLAKGIYGDGLVVSTGGGIVIDPANRANLGRFGKVVCLKASVEVILERAGDGAQRPLLKGPEKREAIERLLKEREAAYAECDLLVDTTGKTIEDVVSAIKAFL